ncbi:unnamed protein product, partial [Chrysoparadoxa australica]
MHLLHLRWWDLDTIDAADVDSDIRYCFHLKPIRELFTAEGVIIKCLERGGERGDITDHFLLTSAGGQLLKVPLTEGVDLEVLMSFHAGPVTGVDTSPVSHLAVTCSDDGTVRTWDYLTKRCMEVASFPQPATCLQWAPAKVDLTGSTVAVGFADGVVRVLARSPNSPGADSKSDGAQKGKGLGAFQKAQVYKPHGAPVTALSYSDNGRFIASVGKDGNLFLMRASQTADNMAYAAVGFIKLSGKGYCIPNSLCWRPDGKRIMFTCNKGLAGEVDVSEGNIATDTSHTFELTKVTSKTYNFKKRPVPKFEEQATETEEATGAAVNANASANANPSDGQDKEEKPQAKEPEEPPPNILAGCYLPDSEDSFLLTCGGWAAGAIFECAWEEEYPSCELATGYGPRATAATGAKPPAVHTLKYGGPDNKWLIAGADDGAITVRPAAARQVYARSQSHDHLSPVAGAVLSYDGNWLISSASDGVLVVQRMRQEALLSASEELTSETKHFQLPQSLCPASSPKHAVSPKAPVPPAAPKPSEELSKVPYLHEYLDEGEGHMAPLADLGFETVQVGAKELQQLSEVAKVQTEACDITDKKTYSIQEAKLKREEDNRLAAAEEKKQKTRRAVELMRDEFCCIMEADAQLPPEQRLAPKDKIIDPEYVALLEEQGREMCREVERELEYETELSKRKLAKLKERFIDDCEVDSISLHALQWDYQVDSFRTGKLKPELLSMLEAAHLEIQKEKQIKAREAKQVRVLEGAPPGTSGKGTLGNDRSKNDLAKSGQEKAANDMNSCHSGGSHGGGNHERQSTFELRRQRRAERQCALKRLLETKPAEDADDPRDIAAIAHAETSMGDYKLKFSPDYEVPEGQELNVGEKQREMLLLEETLYSTKMRFNESFLALRKLKKDIMSNISRDNERIQVIDAELGIPPEEQPDLWMPEIDASEWPELLHRVTPDDLKAYQAEVAAKGPENAQPPKLRSVTIQDIEAVVSRFILLPPATTVGAQDQGGEQKLPTATDGSGSPFAGDTSEAGAADDSKAKTAANLDTMELLSKPDKVVQMLPPVEGSLATIEGPPSELQQEERTVQEMLLMNERTLLLENTAANVLSFDEAVYDLRRERMRVVCKLKAAELRQLLLLQELELLKQFDERDVALAKKFAERKKEKADVVNAIAEGNSKLSIKKAEIEVWEKKTASLMTEFQEAVPEGSGWHGQLLKIFKKKIKRARRSNEDEEEEEDSDDDDDYDFSDDEEEVDDSCPVGCDIAMYDTVIQLREKRLDQEESAAEVMKHIDDLSRTLDRQTTRQRQIDKDLTQTGKEIKAFQTEKQTKINNLDVVVALKLNQVFMMQRSADEDAAAGNEDVAVPDRNDEDEGNSPQHFATTAMEESANFSKGSKLEADAAVGAHVLFTKSGLRRLKGRIDELIEENKVVRANFKNLHRERSILAKTQVEMEGARTAAMAKCNDLQMLKFGRLIELEVLDRVSSGLGGHDKAMRTMETMEVKQGSEVAELEVEGKKLQSDLLSATKENTELLEEIARLSSRQFLLEKELNQDGAGALNDTVPTMRREMEERKGLMALVKLQARELEAIKSEIYMLRRKGGHIYEPIQTEAPTPAPAYQVPEEDE